MSNIHEEIDTLRKEVEICKKNISTNTDKTLKNISLLNKELKRLSEKGWKIYYKEGNSAGGIVKDSDGRTISRYQIDDGYRNSRTEIQLSNPKKYEKMERKMQD